MTNAAIQRQMNRLSLLRQFPTEPEVVKVLADTLRKLTENEHELHQLVTAWCEFSEYSPTEAGLRTQLSALREAQQPPEDFKSPKCRICGGTGYSPLWWLVTMHRHPNGSNHEQTEYITEEQYHDLRRKLVRDEKWEQQVYSGVQRCSECKRGRAISAAILAKEAEAHKGSKRV